MADDKEIKEPLLKNVTLAQPPLPPPSLSELPLLRPLGNTPVFSTSGATSALAESSTSAATSASASSLVERSSTLSTANGLVGSGANEKQSHIKIYDIPNDLTTKVLEFCDGTTIRAFAQAHSKTLHKVRVSGSIVKAKLLLDFFDKIVVTIGAMPKEMHAREAKYMHQEHELCFPLACDLNYTRPGLSPNHCLRDSSSFAGVCCVLGASCLSGAIAMTSGVCIPHMSPVFYIFGGCCLGMGFGYKKAALRYKNRFTGKELLFRPDDVTFEKMEHVLKHFHLDDIDENTEKKLTAKFREMCETTLAPLLSVNIGDIEVFTLTVQFINAITVPALKEIAMQIILEKFKEEKISDKLIEPVNTIKLLIFAEKFYCNLGEERWRDESLKKTTLDYLDAVFTKLNAAYVPGFAEHLSTSDREILMQIKDKLSLLGQEGRVPEAIRTQALEIYQHLNINLASLEIERKLSRR